MNDSNINLNMMKLTYVSIYMRILYIKKFQDGRK